MTYDISVAVGKKSYSFWVVSYLIVILIFNMKNKYIFRISLLTFLLCQMLIFSYKTYYFHNQVTFLNLGQADTTIIYQNGYVVVVDAYKGTLSYLKKEGISQIDYLILTHNDLDHTYEANELLLNLEVKNIYLSGYQSYDLIPKYANYITSDNLSYIKEIDLIFLSPFIKQDNKNEDSIVFKIKVNELTYLFTADIGIETEKILVLKYKDELKSDVLKVGHHGSITSTSSLFLSYVKPIYAVIMVGKDNKFKFPHDEVISRLLSLGIKVYRTDLDLDVIFR